jgi:hypothetical protein
MEQRSETEDLGLGSVSPEAGEDAEEITKQALLREMGLSYGQFYRWKRMGLIPEAWFRRRSTFTGQETFLPRRKVLERISRILELKDRYSLDDIAAMVAPDAGSRGYALAELRQRGWVSAQSWALLPLDPERTEIAFLDLVCLLMIEQLVQSGMRDDLVRQVAEALLDRFDALDGAADRALVVAEKDGVAFIALHTGGCVFDRGATVVASVDLNRLVETARVRLSELTG